MKASERRARLHVQSLNFYGFALTKELQDTLTQVIWLKIMEPQVSFIRDKNRVARIRAFKRRYANPPFTVECRKPEDELRDGQTLWEIHVPDKATFMVIFDMRYYEYGKITEILPPLTAPSIVLLDA